MKFLPCVLLFALAGCRPPEHTNDLQPDLAQIQKWMPANCSVAEFIRIMEKHGFRCEADPKNVRNVLCSCGDSNTSRFIAFVVEDGRPSILYEHALTVQQPNNAVERTGLAPRRSP